MAARLRPADPMEVAAALTRFGRGDASVPDLRLLTKHFLALLADRAPGHAVEVRVPPYAAVQCVAGVRHTRGSPAAVVEADPVTWIKLATGELTWSSAIGQGLTHSGERSDLSSWLPLHRP